MVLVSSRWNQVADFALLCMWGVIAFSMLSAIDYFRKFWHKVDDKIKQRRRRELLLLQRQAKRSAMLSRTDASFTERI
jgi:CDP-diacylglycerol--glycerol-3-phosphate 3-phosphatidyltransferase